MRALLGMMCVGALVVQQGCLPNFDKLDERACDRNEDCPSQFCVEGNCALVGDDPDPEMSPDPNPTPDPGMMMFQTSKVDILWVIDNSGSMCEEQEFLREDFDLFIEKLTAVDADFRLAVVTTDMVDPQESGRFQNIPDGNPSPSCELSIDISNCPTPENGGAFAPLVLRSEDYENEAGDLDTARLQRDFGCNATTGTQGNGFEMGLEAARTALSPELLTTSNRGFLRDDALLGVVFMTDENDCSDDGAVDKINGNICEWEEDKLVPVQEYVDFFTSLKDNDPSRVVMAGLIGPDSGIRYAFGEEVQPSCFSDLGGDGFSGYRYEQVIESFEFSFIADVCGAPYDNDLNNIGGLFQARLER